MSEESYQARTLPQVVAEAAASYGDRIAITDGEVNLSYAELDAARLQAARAFVASGLKKGDRIACYSLNHPQMLVVLFAAARIGVLLVPLNWRLAMPELQITTVAVAARSGAVVVTRRPIQVRTVAKARPETTPTNSNTSSLVVQAEQDREQPLAECRAELST